MVASDRSSLIARLCHFLVCKPHHLPGRLREPETLARVHVYLVNAPLTTVHLKKRNRFVTFAGLSLKGANKQHAYNGYLGVTVQQHMYCRHRFWLRYPDMPCIEEHTKKGHVNYYPIECLCLEPHPWHLEPHSSMDDAFGGSTAGAVVDERQSLPFSWRKRGMRRVWTKTPALSL